MATTTLPVELDDSVKGKSLFDSVKEVNITSNRLFTYGIYKEAEPEHVYENDFNHLQSKVPFLKGLHQDQIKLETERIVNRGIGGSQKQTVSELVGVGVGLYYASKLLNINKNRFIKIPESNRKTLDFRGTSNDKLYEIELKGRTSEDDVSQCINDCLEKKKKGQTKAHLKFGVITILREPTGAKNSKIIVCDDPPEDNLISTEEVINNIIRHYALILSFTLDNRYYNRFIFRLNKGRSVFVNKKAFLNKYVLKFGDKNQTYFGAYFDKRLILERIKRHFFEGLNLKKLFQLVTSESGKEKYFLGMNEKIIDLINKNDFPGLLEYYESEYYAESEKKLTLLDNDGVIFIKSIDAADDQIEENYPEVRVEKIFGLMVQFIYGQTHRCGAPCRSKGKEGKPCDIWTYAEYCHFHR